MRQGSHPDLFLFLAVNTGNFVSENRSIINATVGSATVLNLFFFFFFLSFFLRFCGVGGGGGRVERGGLKEKDI